MLRKIADFLTGKDIDRSADALKQAAELTRVEAFNAGVNACASWHMERAAHYARQTYDEGAKEIFHESAAQSLLKLKR